MPKSIISDWKNLKCYPDPKNASLHRWTYEFLRRNHDYQRDFLEVKRAYDSFVPGKLASLQKSGDIFTAGLPILDVNESNGGISTAGINTLEINELREPCVYDPPRNEGETTNEWFRRVDNGKHVPKNEFYATKWGLKWRLFDPFEDYEHNFTLSVKPSSEWDDESFGLYVPRFKTFDGYLRNFINFENAPPAWIAGPAWDGFNKLDNDAFIIDYRRPINTQIALIKRTAKERQDFLVENGVIPKRKETRNPSKKETRYPNRELYRQYLQLLDGIDDGISLDEIAKVILPGISNKHPDFTRNNRIKKQIKAAEKLRDKGFRFLLATGK